MLQKEKFPRLLLISHNVYDISNNVGKTLHSLLLEWPKELLFSLYFRDEMPKEYFCSSYFMLHDKDIVKTLATLGVYSGGKVFNGNSAKKIEDQNKKIETLLYKLGNKRNPYISFFRDIAWHLCVKRIKSNLMKWLDQTKPQVILFVPNDYLLAFDIMYLVKKYTNAKMVTFYMDDAFYVGHNIHGINALRRKKLFSAGIKCAQLSEKLFTTCDAMTKEYTTIFGLKCISFGNVVDPIMNTNIPINNQELLSVYIGNLHSNRWKSLLDIGNAICSLNKAENMDYKLHIYSASNIDRCVIDLFEKTKTIIFHGGISSSEVRAVQMKADILVHAESFDAKSKASTRLSISTKIFEYLAAAKPIFAYGPNDIASMQYLENTGASINCYDKDNGILQSSLKRLLDSPYLRSELAKRGALFAKLYCDPQRIRNNFINEIKKISNN